MRVVTITEAKNGLSALIDEVQTGESVVIVDRGRPVARLETAVAMTSGDDDGRLARLQRSGIVRMSAGPVAGPGTPATVRPGTGASALDSLLEERDAHR